MKWLALAAMITGWAAQSHAQSFDLQSVGTGHGAVLNDGHDITQSAALEVGRPSGINLYEERAAVDNIILRFRIPNTPAAIMKAEIIDGLGRQIQFRMLSSERLGLILGTHRDQVELHQTHRIDKDGQFQLIISAVKDGVHFLPSKEDLYLTNLEYDKLCFDIAPLEHSDTAININVAIDISGSMRNAIRDVRRSFADFLGALPANAQCQVVLFDHKRYGLNADTGKLSQGGTHFASCAAFQNPTALQAIQSLNGRTRIANALLPIFENHQSTDEAFNMLLVISDGIGDEEKEAFERLQAMRDAAVEANGIYTVINWLGDYDTSYPLKALADEEVIGVLRNQPVAAGFFARSNNFISSQAKITPKACL